VVALSFPVTVTETVKVPVASKVLAGKVIEDSLVTTLDIKTVVSVES